MIEYWNWRYGKQPVLAGPENGARLMKILIVAAVLLAASAFNAYSQETVALVKYGGNLKKIAVSIEGKPYWFLFDSGAGETIISPELARLLNKQVYGSVTGYRHTGEKFMYQLCDGVSIKIGGAAIPHETLGVYDLMSFLPKGAPKIDGVISLKTFQGRILSIDLGANKLTLETKKSAKKKERHMAPVTSRFATGPDGSQLDIFTAIRREGKLYWFLLDTGNLQPVLVSSHVARDWGLAVEPASTSTARMMDIAFGKGTDAVAFSVDDMIYDGMLSFDFISKKVLLLDLGKKQMWAE